MRGLGGFLYFTFLHVEVSMKGPGSKDGSMKGYGSFRKLGVPYLGFLVIRILLFGVLY